MPYNELRKDYLLNRWVVIATERSRRPSDFASQKTESEKSTQCPLCVGNEQMTPPATMLYLKEDGKIRKAKDPPVGDRPKNWLIRVIPNLYPAFAPPKQPQDIETILETESFGNAIGFHEVIIESPNHQEDPADADLSQLSLVIQAYVDRLREFSSRPFIKYVSIFRNFGKEAGASLSHAHSQIIATPMIPTLVQQEIEASKAFYQKRGKCFFCELVEQESQGSRVIYNNSDFLVFAPYASICPMEFWIIPKKHDPTILNLSNSEIDSLAKVLKSSLRALKELVNDPPYNYGFHLAVKSDEKDYYHWHLEVYPKLSIWAGFEISTGTYINTVTPEIAAVSYRKSMRL